MTAKKKTAGKDEAAEAKEKRAEEKRAEEKRAEKAEKAEEKPAKAERKKPVERKFVDAKTGKAIEAPRQGGTGKDMKAVREEMHEARKGNALPFRIGAVVLWALGLICEVVAILVMNGTLYLPGPNATTWLIIWLVIDLVLVVVGSQLWKRANHVSPASKENKLAYWVQTELGTLIAVIAFAPIIILMLTNKDLDKNTKRIGSIVAAVALVVACASGIDWHPATQEELDEAEAGAAVLSDDGLCYWTPFGKVYHFNPDCQYIKNSATIYSGTIKDAVEAKRDEGCSGCTVEGGTDVLSNSDPDDVAEMAAKAISVIAGGKDAEGESEDGGPSGDKALDGDLQQAA